MTSWNINSVLNKLDNPQIQDILDADIVYLNEIKTPLKLSLPGFTSIRSQGQYQHRGGCAVFIWNNMWKDVISLDASHMDMVYFQLRFLPRVHFISVYIPPSDSPYSCLSNLAWMSGKIQDNPTDQFLVMGDTNTRFGSILDNFSKNHAST